jgi:hypothetical protein
VITGVILFSSPPTSRSNLAAKAGPSLRLAADTDADPNIRSDPPSDLVSTDEIDGDSDPLVRPGRVGGDDEGIRVARMITSLCFLRIGLLPGIEGRESGGGTTE